MPNGLAAIYKVPAAGRGQIQPFLDRNIRGVTKGKGKGKGKAKAEVRERARPPSVTGPRAVLPLYPHPRPPRGLRE